MGELVVIWIECGGVVRLGVQPFREREVHSIRKGLEGAKVEVGSESKRKTWKMKEEHIEETMVYRVLTLYMMTMNNEGRLKFENGVTGE